MVVTARSRSTWLAAIEPTCEAIAALLHPHAEVVVHDVGTDRIVGLWNGFSGRSVGDPSLLSQLPAPVGGSRMLGPYPKVLADGRRLTSVSAIVSDAHGGPIAMVCVNLDRSPLDGAIEMLQRFAAPLTNRPPELFERDWREQIALVVDDRCRERSWRRDRLTRGARLELVQELDARGLFATRHAAEHAARALGISRASVYALLKEARA